MQLSKSQCKKKLPQIIGFSVTITCGNFHSRQAHIIPIDAPTHLWTLFEIGGRLSWWSQPLSQHGPAEELSLHPRLWNPPISIHPRRGRLAWLGTQFRLPREAWLTVVFSMASSAPEAERHFSWVPTHADIEPMPAYRPVPVEQQQNHLLPATRKASNSLRGCFLREKEELFSFKGMCHA